MKEEFLSLILKIFSSIVPLFIGLFYLNKKKGKCIDSQIFIFQKISFPSKITLFN
ncbi:hypothetical protein FEM08_01370 [Flavobacterium gilvum]|nr:hypothetical protein FEM08_01370 [Flavobacterium gilvum]